jgi:hypothetical protein
VARLRLGSEGADVTEQPEQNQGSQPDLTVRDNLDRIVRSMHENPERFFAVAREKQAPLARQDVQRRLATMESERKAKRRERRRQILDRVRDVTRRAVGGHGRSAR